MIYATIDVALKDHPKAIEAGPAMYLWTWAMLWLRDHRENGLLTREVVLKSSWGVGREHNKRAARRLVDAGLWSEVPGGWVVNNYSAKNDTREIIQERIESKKEANRRQYEKKVVTKTISNVDSDKIQIVLPGAGAGAGDPMVVVSSPEPPTPQRPPTDLFGATFLAEAYADGQRDAGAELYPTPRSPAAIRALDEMASSGAPAGPGRAQWVRTTSAAYRRAKAASVAFEKGYDPVKCLEWIRAGRPNDSTPKQAFVRNAVPDTPPAPYHRQSAGYVRKKGEESVTPQQVGDLIAAIGKAQ